MTKTAKHSLLFRLWIRIRGLLAFIIVVFGVIVGLVSLILPNEKLYKHHVVDFLSKQWGKQVEIQNISGKWKGFGPKFIIKGLVIKGADEVVVQQTSLSINVFKYFIPKGSTGIILTIDDAAVDFERKISGQIVLTGKSKKNQSFSKELEKLLSSGTLSVKNLSLNLKDSINNTQSQINSKITVQQNDNNRAFSLELDSKELADKLIIKAVTEKTNDFMKQANWYISADNLSISRLKKLLNQSYLPNTMVDAQIWFSTVKGNIVRLIAKAHLKDTFLGGGSEITGDAELVYKGNIRNWSAELTIKDIKTKSISQDKIIIRIERDQSFIYLNADVLDIPLLKSLTQIINISNDEFENLQLNGKLTDVQIKYDVKLRRIVDAKIHFQQLDFAAGFGKLVNLSGMVSMHDDQIRLLIDSDEGFAEFPGVIRGQVNWDKLLLTAQTSMQDDDLDIKINSLWCDCKDFIIDGSARIAYDEQLLMDLTFAVYEAKVNKLYKYWPSNKWKPKALNFLDNALVSGVVDKGMIIYHGLVSEYPFNQGQGVFVTRSNLINATVDYHKDWPVVKDFNAVVITKNRNLTVHSSQGNVMEGKIKNVFAEIESLTQPILKVTINASGKDNFLIDILNQSPMKKGLKVLNQDITLKGKQQIKISIDIPLNKPDVKVEPIGEIHFQKTDFQMGQFQLHDLIGTMEFEGFSLMLNEIKSTFLNREVTISGEILNKPNENATVDVLLNGYYNVENFESVLGLKLPAQGDSSWFFNISNTSTTEICFTAKSDLIGVQLDIPEPFSKSQEQLTPFSITCTLPCTDGGWDIDFDNKLTSNFNINTITNEFQLNKLIFGEKSEEYEGTGFGGQLDVVDVDKWIEIIAKNKSKKQNEKLPFDQMSLHINKLIFMSRELLDVSVNIVSEDDGIVFNIEAKNIKGRVTIAKDIDRKGIVVQLEKLHWLDSNIEQMPQSLSKISSKYPALHVYIGDFIYDGIPLGESSIEVRPVAEGLRVEKFNTKSDLMNLNINGIWLRHQDGKGLSIFNIIMTSRDVAKFLNKLGFQAPISEAQTIIDMQAQWDGLPSQFEIKNISGKMRIEIGEGEVVDAKPGMGRVLGLFSLTNLPRRLILDFKDVVGKGLHFQSMQGDFTIIKGEAHTESFVIDSASAKIIVKGKTGLANQDYDQIVVVTPRVGRVLPTIGAIAGGAVGAAAGFIVQGMFSKGLKNVGKIIYKVTGSWDDPIIELIETEDKAKKNINEK